MKMDATFDESALCRFSFQRKIMKLLYTEYECIKI